MRAALVTALSDCVDGRRRNKARQFLQGLSADELQYIADFIGASILEEAPRAKCSRRQLAEGIHQFARCRGDVAKRKPGTRSDLPDCEHKMILLLEYLCRAGLTNWSPALRTGTARS